MASIIGPLDEQMMLAYLAPYRPRTRENYRYTLLEWLRWCGQAKIPVLAIERVHIEAWRRYQSAIGLTDNTIRSKLIPIIGFYRWAYEQRRIDIDPARNIRRPGQPQASTRDWLSRGELNRMLAQSLQAHPSIRALAHLGALNGLRLGEMLRLNVGDRTRHDDRPALRIRDRKPGTGDVIGLTEATAAAVEAAAGKRRSGALLLSPRDGKRRLSNQTARNWLDRLVRDAGIDRRITPHCLRTTFITLSLEAGVPLHIVADSAGQQSLTTTYYYDRQRNALGHNATHRLVDWLDGD